MDQRGVHGYGPKALAWVLKFAQEDLAALCEGDLIYRWEEVTQFALCGGLGRLEDIRVAPIGNQFGSAWDLPAGSTVGEYLAELQGAVLQALSGFVGDKGGLAIKVPVAILVLVSKGRAGVTVIGQSPTTGMLYHLAQLLGEVGLRVRRCRGCPKLLYVTRSEKVYCDARCRAKAFKREKRAKKQSGTTTQRRTNHGTTR